MNPRIFGAFVIGVALMGGAYTMSDFGVSDSSVTAGDPTVAVVVGKAPARSYISTNDANNDGVPDWQEALRTTDPLIIEEISTSTYELPDTVTDEFAREFFERTVRAKGIGVFGSTPEEIVTTATADLALEATDELLTLDDIILSSNNDPEAVRAYGNDLMAITIKYSFDNRSEVQIVLDALRNSDESALNELDPIATAYQNMLADTLALPVPSDLAKEHLDYANSLQAIMRDVEIFALAFEDPLLTMMRMQRYQDDATGLYFSLQNISLEMLNQGIRYEEEESGFLLFAFLVDLLEN